MSCDAAVPKLEDILPKLSAKFVDNVNRSLLAAPAILGPIEIKARAISILGELLRSASALQAHQVQLSVAFDEVFSDLILSTYLSACCLDNPCRIVLRRALETGIALAYLWDSPLAFYGWTVHDKDLSFKAMIDAIAGDSYKSLLSIENADYAGEAVIDVTEADELYREFSNVTHGKWTTFESSLPDRFSYNVADLTAHLSRISEVETILLNVWKVRFAPQFSELTKRVPALKGVK